jgi:hypothetical protein
MNQPSALREPEDIFTQVTVRPLCADDSPAYHALRSRILALGEGKYFSDSYLREKSFVSENDWREWCTEKREHCTIGTFIGSELVGTMGIVRYGTPEDRTVEWEVTWMDPRYRTVALRAKPMRRLSNGPESKAINMLFFSFAPIICARGQYAKSRGPFLPASSQAKYGLMAASLMPIVSG